MALRPCILLIGITLAARLAAGPIWTQVWADNGDGAANTPPDSSQWRYDLGGGGWGNNELESYTNRVQNARYDGAGDLLIEARAEAYTGSDGIPRNYTSARLLTAATFSQAYGRFEARIKIPAGQGMWPAFWMLGNNIGSVGWPTCGEIDIMENVGFEPNITHGTIHGPGYSGGAGIAAAFDLGAPVSAAFHEFAVEWEPQIIRFYVDGVERVARTPADLPGGTTWVYDHPHFLLLNLAVGGGWPGNPDASTVFPQAMTVDYVRVYQRDTAQRPFAGTPLPIPGTLQAEDFDDGGPEVAYHDTTVGHPGGVNMPRNSEQVDLEPCSDAGGGDDLGWTAPGEWLAYTVDVAAAGAYALSARLASADAGGTFRFELDGAPIANSQFSVPNSGGWQTWTTLGPQTVTLPAGRHVLRLAYLSAGPGGGCGNLNWFRFDSLVPPSPSATPSRTPLPVATPTLTATRTATRSASPTASATPSASPSRTPSASPTRSASPSPQASPSLSPTPSSSPLASPTVTLSAAPSAIATSSATPPFSPGPSATASPSAELSLTPSPSDTAAASPPSSPIPSPSVTVTVTVTLTGTPSATPSATFTATPSATAAFSPGASRTVTASPASSPSATPTASATPSPTTLATEATPLPLESASPAPAPDEPRLLPLYDPQRGQSLRFAIQSGGLQRAHLRCYSPAMALVGDLDLGTLAPGWQRAVLDLPGLTPGLYWARLSADGRPLGKPVRILLWSN